MQRTQDNCQAHMATLKMIMEMKMIMDSDDAAVADNEDDANDDGRKCE